MCFITGQLSSINVQTPPPQNSRWQHCSSFPIVFNGLDCESQRDTLHTQTTIAVEVSTARLLVSVLLWFVLWNIYWQCNNLQDPKNRIIPLNLRHITNFNNLSNIRWRVQYLNNINNSAADMQPFLCPTCTQKLKRLHAHTPDTAHPLPSLSLIASITANWSKGWKRCFFFS